MTTTIRPVQLAYFVTDIRKAARQAAKTWGAGPFFVLDRIELDACTHRGVERSFVHSSAYGQWGTIMIELVQQDEEGPSPFRDLYAPGEEGLHHVASFIDDMTTTIDAYREAGIELATRAVTRGGATEFAFLDTTKRHGHMLEIYERSESLARFYEFVRAAASGWDGRDPVRSL